MGRISVPACLLLMGLATNCAAQDAANAASGTRPAEMRAAASAIKTRAELEKHLQSAQDSPLNLLSPLARRRFVESLQFGPKGADPYRFDRIDLMAELTAGQIKTLLAAFGIQPDGYLLQQAREHHKTAARIAEEATPSTIAKAYDAYYRAMDVAESLSERERRNAIEKAYSIFASTPSSPLPELSAGDMELRYRAVATTAFYSDRPEYARRQMTLLDHLKKRNQAQPGFYADAYRSLIGARLFFDAEKLRAAHPDGLRPLPKLVEDASLPEGKTAWRADPKKTELKRIPVALLSDAKIVVVSHPSCHYSQDASKAISADPVLGPMFERNAMWLAPPLNANDFDVVQSWNREHPSMQMLIAYSREEWPEFENWATPIFYFLKDGRLVGTVRGWRGEASRQEVIAEARKDGLLPKTAHRLTSRTRDAAR